VQFTLFAVSLSHWILNVSVGFQIRTYLRLNYLNLHNHLFCFCSCLPVGVHTILPHICVTRTAAFCIFCWSSSRILQCIYTTRKYTRYSAVT